MLVGEEKFDNVELLIFLLEELSLRPLEPEDAEFVRELSDRLDTNPTPQLTPEEKERLMLLARKYGAGTIELEGESTLHPLA